MKKICLVLLLACTSTAYAVPNLDDTYNDNSYDSYAYTPPAATSTNQILNKLNKLQSDMSQLKNKIADQSRGLADLKARQNRLEQRWSVAVPVESNYRRVSQTTSTLDEHDPHNELPDEKSRYGHAYSVLKNGGYDQAIAEFQTIINTYPNGEYADNSQYWTGEALLKKGDKKRAMRAFDRVIYAYPRSPKVPDALLKLGITQASIGNSTKAREYFDYLIEAYPGTPSANTAYTKKLQAGL